MPGVLLVLVRIVAAVGIVPVEKELIALATVVLKRVVQALSTVVDLRAHAANHVVVKQWHQASPPLRTDGASPCMRSSVSPLSSLSAWKRSRRTICARNSGGIGSGNIKKWASQQKRT